MAGFHPDRAGGGKPSAEGSPLDEITRLEGIIASQEREIEALNRNLETAREQRATLEVTLDEVYELVKPARR